MLLIPYQRPLFNNFPVYMLYCYLQINILIEKIKEDEGNTKVILEKTKGPIYYNTNR